MLQNSLILGESSLDPITEMDIFISSTFFSVLLDCLIWRYLTYYLGFPGDSDGKEPPPM